ncbi:FAD-dependent oxidoreductase [Lentisphaera araneosa]|uniref:FAD-dependent oxidoreductase n=1 Tax=Lentisphaera araneosa TaxID=256847 RepID=UPI003B75C57D
MEKVTKEVRHWTVCCECKGRGRKTRKVTKKRKRRYQDELKEFEKNNRLGEAPIRPRGHQDACKVCGGSGLSVAEKNTLVDTENYPHLAIIGGGIGGVALAMACLHRGIPFTIYERDRGFSTRSQGYGLTLQQASKAIEGLGIFNLEKGLTSTRHVVHNIDGKELGEWGVRKWEALAEKNPSKRRNIHIARQSLREALLEQLGSQETVQWGHHLVDFQEADDGTIDLRFQIDGEVNDQHAKADLVVGADGIRSSVRRLLIGEELTPLRYLGCIVILGICPLANLGGLEHELLDSSTVFQTANGHERMYMMPYSSDAIMWQLSFPLSENDAKELSSRGPQALKDEACQRCQWHDPIPQILKATESTQVSGYPVYDRALLKSNDLKNAGQVTLIGDAAHPMSPFKGQGANQALLDALALARSITAQCRPLSNWKALGIREAVLNDFESEMISRSSTKVQESAAAAEFLHSEIALHESDQPRAKCRKKES